jgi:hypothetical protein
VKIKPSTKFSAYDLRFPRRRVWRWLSSGL